MSENLKDIIDRRQELELIPAIPVRRAATILRLDVRTVYRNLDKFELLKRNGRWYITLRSLRAFIDRELYRPGR